MTSSSLRLGVDIGGTFTDVVLEQDGTLFSTKVLTTYAAPENAIIDGMHQVCKKAGVTPSQITQIIHGTTRRARGRKWRDTGRYGPRRSRSGCRPNRRGRL